MLKKYKAKSQISVCVKLPNGGNARVSFSALTGGGSVFYTHNADLQKGLERHQMYGHLFTLESQVQDEPTPTIDAPKKVVSPAEEAPAKRTVQTFEATCNDDAKDYLAEKFGVSRSKMRSKEQITNAAKANGVEIIWK